MKIKLVGIFFLFTLSTSAFAEDWYFHYVDDFDDANNGIDRGLNSNLDNRQHYGPWEGVTWVRRDGHWNPKSSNPPHLSQVNHSNAPDRLVFFLEPSAVMLNYRIWPGAAGRYRVSYKTDPRMYDSTDGAWTSFMLDSSYTASGYPTQVDFGFLIRSNGVVSVIQNGNSKTVSGNATPAHVYDVVLDIKPGELKAKINGKTITADLDEPLPTSAHPYLGAYIAESSGVQSWFDDLVINTQRGTTSGHLSKYGYYWADSPTHGSHLDEISDYTNFNYIAIDTSNLTELSGSDLRNKCHPKKCVLEVRWQFWPYTKGDPNWGMLRSNWLAYWGDVRDAIRADNNEDLLAALYIVDEPFWAVGVDLEDYETVLAQVKQDFPDLPIMAAFTWRSVDSSMPFVAGLDWVAAIKYDVHPNNFDVISDLQDDLHSRQPGKGSFLVPINHVNGDVPLSDAERAYLNWLYYDLALKNNNTIGLMNFGLWTHAAPSTVPVTIKTQKLIGDAITQYDAPPPGC